MPNSSGTTLMREWADRFRKDGFASAVLAGLEQRQAEIWQSTVELLKRESPEYRNSIDDEFSQESKSHCGELLRMIVAVGAGRLKPGEADPFDFVRTHAQWRARHHVPLIASLHAYRLGHRTYWTITREALLRHPRQKEALRALATLSDFWIELFDHVGAVFAEAHAIEEGLILARSTRTYVGLVDDLLRGAGPRDREAERLCGFCGIRSDVPLAVVVARPLLSPVGAHADLEVSLRSLARLLEEALPATEFGKLIQIRDAEVTAIVCRNAETARDALDALRKSGLGKRASNGLAAGVGLSLDATEVARLPQALREARLALDFAHKARPLVPFSGIDLPDFLIRRADDAAFRLIPAWVHQFSSDDPRSRALARTVRSFADCNFNVKRTARRLNVHANTVYFRLNRIRKLSGIDPRTFAGTSLLLTALRLLELRGGGKKAAGQANPVAGAVGSEHSFEP